VATSGDIAATPSNCLTDTSQNSYIVVTSSFQDFKPLDSGTSLESWAVVLCGFVVLDELDVFKIVCPYAKSTSTRRLSNIV
jgi:hypothetical protein